MATDNLITRSANDSIFGSLFAPLQPTATGEFLRTALGGGYFSPFASGSGGNVYGKSISGVQFQPIRDPLAPGGTIQGPLNRPSTAGLTNPNVVSWEQGLSDTIYSGGLSFSGTDINATCFIPAKWSSGTMIGDNSYKRFGELQTITVSSNRGVYPVRRLGETWVTEYVKGTRTIAGTLIFSVLQNDVFRNLYQIDKRDTRSSSIFVDMLPPFTIGLHAINEAGREASMFLTDVTLTNFGMTISVDDLFIESTYNYVAKWATPFMPGNLSKNLGDLAQILSKEGVANRVSDLLIDGIPASKIQTVIGNNTNYSWYSNKYNSNGR